MRILHVVPTYIPAYRYGGPIRSVHGLCRGLAARGHDVHVFTTNVDGPEDSDVPLGAPVDLDGVKVWYFPSRRLRRIYRSPAMAKAFKERIPSFDLCHLHSIYLWPTFTAARAARKAGIPYIISPRGMLVKDLVARKSRWPKTIWLTLIERTNLEGAAAIHVTSPLERADAVKFGYRLPAVFIVPNGVDLDDEKDTMTASPIIRRLLPESKPYILYVGRINWKKGLERLIQALQYLQDIDLIIAGNDEENYTPVLEELAVTHSVQDRIRFIGAVYGAEKAVLIKKALVLALPSYSENFGNVVLEAMAAGCPVAVTSQVGAADIVREYGAGLVIDGDPAILGDGLRNMLANTVELARMGKRGQKAVENHFTWDAVAGRMEAVYHQILKEYQVQNA